MMEENEGDHALMVIIFSVCQYWPEGKDYSIRLQKN